MFSNFPKMSACYVLINQVLIKWKKFTTVWLLFIFLQKSSKRSRFPLQQYNCYSYFRGKVSALTLIHISAVTSSHISTITSIHISAVTPIHISTITSTYISAMNFNCISAVRSFHISPITAIHISAINFDYIFVPRLCLKKTVTPRRNLFPATQV